MEPAPVIKGFDELEDGLASLSSGFEAAAVDEFLFERAPERFHGGVVIAAGFTAHGRYGFCVGQGLAKISAGVLATTIGVEKEFWQGLAMVLSHVPGRED